jgi:hypothetical protein
MNELKDIKRKMKYLKIEFIVSSTLHGWSFEEIGRGWVKIID